MAKEDPNLDLPVTDRVCLARMETLKSEIDGLKTTIYAVGLAVSLTVTIVQILFKFFLK